jgi:3-hydroxypropionyl-CoA synthetase (ADP-forming)
LCSMEGYPRPRNPTPPEDAIKDPAWQSGTFLLVGWTVIISSDSLSDYGFARPKWSLAHNEEEVVTQAAEIGYPVALKIVSPEIIHKTDVGGVELGVASEQAARAAYRQIRQNAARKVPLAPIEGVRVEKMIAGGIEVIVGLKQDPQFGPVVMFGLGGIFAELLDDVSFRVLPIDRSDALQMIHEVKGAKVLQGYRGRPPVKEDMLVDLLMQTQRLALLLGDDLESVDLNPIAVWEDQHRVLDATFVTVSDIETLSSAITRGGDRTESEPSIGAEVVRRPADVSHLSTFFDAHSVALIGASATPGKIGYAVLDSLAKHEYEGKVYPVNPGRDEILGLKTYPSLSAIADPVDLVICTVDLALVPDLIRECASSGVNNLVVVSGGGKELGGDRAAIEAEIGRLARDLGVRVIGPNCIGAFDGHTRLDTFFQPRERMTRPPAGNVAMMSQSGTIGIAFLEDMQPCGISKFVSYGNRADVNEADLLTHLAEDPKTEVIALYVEGLLDGTGFLEAARRAAARKPVVIFKSGRNATSAKAALTHTGFLAGSYKVAEGAFLQAGLVTVDSYEELVSVTKTLAMQPRASGPRVAMIGNGIGTTVQALDILSDNGLRLAQLSPATVDKLTQAYPSFYIVANPIDVTGSGSSTDYRIGIEALIEDPGVDIVMPWMVFQDVPLNDDIPEVLADLSRRSAKPILCGTIGGTYAQRMAAAIESAGVPVLRSVRDWVAAARGICAPR